MTLAAQEMGHLGSQIRNPGALAYEIGQDALSLRAFEWAIRINHRRRYELLSLLLQLLDWTGTLVVETSALRRIFGVCGGV